MLLAATGTVLNVPLTGQEVTRNRADTMSDHDSLSFIL